MPQATAKGHPQPANPAATIRKTRILRHDRPISFPKAGWPTPRRLFFPEAEGGRTTGRPLPETRGRTSKRLSLPKDVRPHADVLFPKSPARPFPGNAAARQDVSSPHLRNQMRGGHNEEVCAISRYESVSRTAAASTRSLSKDMVHGPERRKRELKGWERKGAQ